MKENPSHKFESECGKVKVYVDNDMTIGSFHDFLLELKGIMIERMNAAQQKQEEQQVLKPQPQDECSKEA